jgi:hypothetical protein
MENIRINWVEPISELECLSASTAGALARFQHSIQSQNHVRASAGLIVLQNATEHSVALCSNLRFPDEILSFTSALMKNLVGKQCHQSKSGVTSNSGLRMFTQDGCSIDGL